jgi:hypothetical protein
VFGDEAARRRAVAHIESLLASRDGLLPGPLPFSLIVLGEPAKALEVIEAGLTQSSVWQLALWHDRGRAARRLPQFGAFARKVGYAALWDAHGPPDNCRKQPNGEYACD